MKSWDKTSLVILGMVGMLNNAALADEPENFSRILGDKIAQQHVLDAARRSTVVINNPCPDAHFSIANKIVIYRPPSFDSSGTVVAGAWKQVVEEQGCGVSRVLNVMAWVPSPKTLATTPLLPGTTHADPQLQKDAVRYAVIASGGPEANCKIGYVADTEFVQHENVASSDGKGPPWQELWTLETCSKKIQVPMRFVPDATGTSIVAGPNTAIKVFPLNARRQHE